MTMRQFITMVIGLNWCRCSEYWSECWPQNLKVNWKNVNQWFMWELFVWITTFGYKNCRRCFLFVCFVWKLQKIQKVFFICLYCLSTCYCFSGCQVSSWLLFAPRPVLPVMMFGHGNYDDDDGYLGDDDNDGRGGVDGVADCRQWPPWLSQLSWAQAQTRPPPSSPCPSTIWPEGHQNLKQISPASALYLRQILRDKI